MARLITLSSEDDNNSINLETHLQSANTSLDLTKYSKIIFN